MAQQDADRILEKAKAAGLEQHPDVKPWVDAVLQFPHEDWVIAAASQIVGRYTHEYEENPFAFRPEYVQATSNPQDDFFQGTCQGHGIYLPKTWRKRSELVVGKPGTGKSTYIRHQVRQALKKGLPVWLFDFKDEHAALSDEKSMEVLHLAELKLNPHELLREPAAVECLAHANLFQNASTGFYRDALHKTEEVYADDAAIPSVYHVRQIAELMSPRKEVPAEFRIDPYRQQTLTARDRVLRALDDILGRYAAVVDCETGFPIEELANRSIRFNCWGMAYKEAVYFIYVLLQALYTYRNAQRAQAGTFDLPLHNLVVIEEAKHVISAEMEEGMRTGPAFIRKITTEVRSSGIGYIFADQVPSALAPSAVESANTITLFRAGLEADLAMIGGAMGLTDEQEQLIYELPDRTAVTKHGEKKPIKLTIPAAR